ncbi:MAG: hypothetical protein LLG42_08935 [Chloroflexi bacterium]|nr:hypothetical protein [Chloroflexota bacterium]
MGTHAEYDQIDVTTI